MSDNKSSIYLRSSLDYSGSGSAANAISKSPDIIPMDVTTLSPEQLQGTYKTFIARPLRNHVNNNIYLRGYSTTATSTTVQLYAVPSLLIFWPDLVQSTGTNVGNVTLKSSATQPIASAPPLLFNPSSLGGRHYSLVSAPQGALPKLASWKDYVSQVVNPTTYSFHNINWADTTQTVFSSASRLVMRDCHNQTVKILINVQAVNLQGATVSLSCDTYNPSGDPLQITATKIASDNITLGVTTVIPNNFDGVLTVNYTKGSDAVSDGAYIALTVNALVEDSGFQDAVLLGTDWLFFDEEVRFSHLHDKKLLADATTNYNDFYFRDQLGDTNAIPRSGTPSSSPDIQPYGYKPATDPNATFINNGTLAKDVSSGLNQGILPNSPNYIYLRGTSPVPTSGFVQLYYVPNTVLSLPQAWKNNQVKDDTGKTDIPFNITTANQSIVLPPFDWLNPAPPAGFDHYCLIARASTTANPNDFTTLFSIADFASWVLGNPAVAWRNVSFTSSSATFSATSKFELPSTWGNTKVMINLVCQNVIGSKVAFSSGTPGPNPPISVDWTDVNSPNVSIGITSVIPAKYSTNLVYSFNANGKSYDNTAQLSFQFVKLNAVGSPFHKFGKPLKDFNFHKLPEGLTGWETGTVLGSLEKLFTA